MSGDKKLHIAVAVVSDEQGRILISQRKVDCAYAGQWEFPGGKCEAGEDVQTALARELREELGLEIRGARPLIRLSHSYPDRNVLLDTWRVTAWQGVPEALEKQRFEWVAPQALDDYPMLAANRPIVRAVQLPDIYLVTPDPALDQEGFLSAFARGVDLGVRLARLRAPSLDSIEYSRLAERCVDLCHSVSTRLLLDRDAGMVETVGADGLHLTATELARHSFRPIARQLLLAASCHSSVELAHAQAIGADFAVLGAVSATATHPNVPTLGWSGFRDAVEPLAMPVYGIGGLGEQELETAWNHGAQGIAAIRALWRS